MLVGCKAMGEEEWGGEGGKGREKGGRENVTRRFS